MDQSEAIEIIKNDLKDTTTVCNPVNVDHLSWSQINCYLNNPREWWFKYVKYPHLKEQMKTFALDQGSEYHTAMEILYKTGSVNDALVSYDDSMVEHEKKNYKRWEIENVRDAIKRYASTIYPLYKSRVSPDNVELNVNTYMIEGVPVPIYLRIDLLTNDGVIIDHKTVGRFSPKAEHNGQGLTYASWYYRTKGILPRGFELHKAYKQPSGDTLVEVQSAPISLPDVLNIEEVYRGVWKSIQAGIFPWGLNAYPSEFRDEYEMMLISGKLT